MKCYVRNEDSYYVIACMLIGDNQTLTVGWKGVRVGREMPPPYPPPWLLNSLTFEGQMKKFRIELFWGGGREIFPAPLNLTLRHWK